MDFRATGVRSLTLNMFLILNEVKTNLIVRSDLQKRLVHVQCKLSEFKFRYFGIMADKREFKIMCIIVIISVLAFLRKRPVKILLETSANNVRGK